MFSMAVFAIIGCSYGKAAMKAGFIVQVVADIFMVMTLYAELSLAVFIRCVMALLTVLLIFFMRLDHRARHQQRCERFGIDVG